MKRNEIKGKIWQVVWQSCAMVLLACAVGLVANESRSERLAMVADWSPEARLGSDSGTSMAISLEEARRLCLKEGAVFLDARLPADFSKGHIQCAKNVPWQSFEKYMDRVWGVIPEGAVIVTYCDGEHCALSEDLAKELITMGYKNVKVLLNGWTRWQEAGLPVEKGDKCRQMAGIDEAGAFS